MKVNLLKKIGIAISLVFTLISCISVIPLQVSADVLNGTGYTLTYNYTNGGIQITGATITNSGTTITIPETIDGSPVLTIGSGAFKGQTKLAGIKLPSCLKYILSYAFSGTSLTTVTVPGKVSNISEYAFYNCTSLKSVTLEDGVTGISMGTFAGCTSLTSVNLSSTIYGIGVGAFQKCTALTSIRIPESIRTIDSKAFKQCSNLRQLMIYGTGASISSDACDGCTPTVYGIAGSTAQTFASTAGLSFAALSGDISEETTTTTTTIPVIILTTTRATTTVPISSSKKGDINGDGLVDSDDATIALQESTAQMLGYSLIAENRKNLADVNNDGNIDSDDAVLILKYMVAEMLGTTLPF